MKKREKERERVNTGYDLYCDCYLGSSSFFISKSRSKRAKREKGTESEGKVGRSKRDLSKNSRNGDFFSNGTKRELKDGKKENTRAVRTTIRYRLVNQRRNNVKYKCKSRYTLLLLYLL